MWIAKKSGYLQFQNEVCNLSIYSITSEYVCMENSLKSMKTILTTVVHLIYDGLNLSNIWSIDLHFLSICWKGAHVAAKWGICDILNVKGFGSN